MHLLVYSHQYHNSSLCAWQLFRSQLVMQDRAPLDTRPNPCAGSTKRDDKSEKERKKKRNTKIKMLLRTTVLSMIKLSLV